MLIYLLLLVFICFDFALEYFLNKKEILSKETRFSRFLNFIFKYRVLTIIVFVFLSTFRYTTVGGDTKQYYQYYTQLQNNFTYRYKYEIGYKTLNFLLAVVFRFDFKVLLFLIASFVSIVFMLFINKYSHDKLMSFLLYVMLGVFGQSFGAVRQIISIAFIIIALFFILDNKLWRGSIFIVIAGLFHVTAFFCLLIIPIKFIKLNHWWLLGAFIGCCIFSILLPYILQLIEYVLPRISFYSKYFTKYSKLYFAKPSLFNSLYSLAMIAIYAVLYLARYKWFKDELENDKAFTYFLTLFTIVPLIRIAGLLIGIESLLNRLNMYFFFLLIILIPRFMKCLRKYNHRGWLYGLAYAGALAYMILNLTFHNSMQIAPYIFWF